MLQINPPDPQPERNHHRKTVTNPSDYPKCSGVAVRWRLCWCAWSLWRHSRAVRTFLIADPSRNLPLREVFLLIGSPTLPVFGLEPWLSWFKTTSLGPVLEHDRVQERKHLPRSGLVNRPGETLERTLRLAAGIPVVRTAYAWRPHGGRRKLRDLSNTPFSHPCGSVSFDLPSLWDDRSNCQPCGLLK